MQLQCSRCHRVLEFADERPLFCSFCGNGLADTQGSEAITLPPPPTPVHEADTLACPPPADGGPDEMPSTIGDYRLLRRLGGGGMGTVYEGEDPTNGRRVALKIISSDYARSADAVQRFRQEGRLASTISHPRCVFVLGADEDGGRPYIVMELMPGPTLQDLLDKEGPLPIGAAVAKTLDIIEGLQEAHQLDVVHRDVKPSNCFLEADGRVKVGDFGLSKSLTVNAHMTRTGAFMGTLLYAAPEQVRGERVDKQTDVYAVTATLYSLLVGQAPFQTGDAAATLARIAADDPPPLRAKLPKAPAVLEQILLRGLARDRTRRYRDLDELRRDLLPFAPGQETAAPLGMRFLAVLLDWVLLLPLVMGSGLLYAQLAMGSLGSVFDPNLSTRPGYLILSPTIFLLYFILCEGWSDATLGKRLLRMRVRTTAFDLPGLGRGLVRGVCFYGLSNLNNFVSQFVLFFFISPEARQDPMTMSRDPYFLLLGLGQWPLLALQYGLLLGTMRKRNGYRGLHEWVSGTRTIALPPPAERRAVKPRRLEDDCTPAENLPRELGPFEIRGVLRHSGERSVLLGEDPGLGRKVVLWVRPASEGPLPVARRELGRPTRLRWLTEGHHENLLWDAFPVPTGCPLPAWVADAGPLPWPHVRPLLESLTTELGAACADSTLPRVLTLEQVWVDTAGRVLLLEAPLNHPATPARPAQGDEEDRALQLLRDVAQLTLEGKPPREDQRQNRVRAPLPEAVRGLLDRLFDEEKPFHRLETWRKSLGAVRERPEETTRARRAIHAAILSAFLFLPVCFLMAPGMTSIFIGFAQTLESAAGNRTLARLHEVAARDFFATGVAPSPAARLGPLALLSADLQTHARLEATLSRQREAGQARYESLSSPALWFLQVMEQVNKPVIEAAEAQRTAAPTFDIRRRANNQASQSLPRQEDVAKPMLVILLVIPGIYIVWTFLLRGGVSSLIAGLTLVRRDGRPAGRLRCAWRCLLAWLPFIGLLAASVGFEVEYWRGWVTGAPEKSLVWLSLATCWLGWALLPVYLLLALYRPGRGPHDVLAGTYVVPR